ncbi:MAG: disulfide bond formation protein B [Actinobacteria bacterium]|nr:disulfide bond formation protein B [Actinomycetota bacterium]
MDTETTTTFFALLAVVAQVVVGAAVVLAVVGRFVPAVARVRSRLAAFVGPQAVALAAVVALVCTLGSLYLSEVADFVPCRLCWLQRFAMYPLVVVLGAAALTRWRALRIAGAVMAAVGASISIYHMLIERFPELENSTSCDPTNPCSLIWVEHFGYLTIPAMALSGFALILTLLAIAGTTTEEHP